ncbi:Ku protein [Rhizobium mayense]|uniref:Non-homologous end joining protein Ku n=1 Tax=Rhizobium mayense TaxID=1312184 RepID=A0ABT7K3P4_9HYPH|nr:Ku protein [Rhizobium mayense]MDL2402588.1 Ku protein [Rhizobium mayense]
MSMSPRAQWKGYLQFGLVTCPVALYTATSTSERVSFHTINRATGNRVRREFIDSSTGKPVGREDQVKGYEVGKDDYVIFEQDEIAAVVPGSDKTLHLQAFVAYADIDDVYFDKPYYLAPSDRGGEEAFALIRAGMQKKKAAAIARTVLFRRLRTLLIRPYDKGLIATTLNYDYEVRSADKAFEDVPDIKIKGEMLDLAKHIIATKSGTFDAQAFDDRYEAALTELIKAKLEGRKITIRKERKPEKVVDLMEALRQSAGVSGEKKRAPKRTASNASRQRKAG